MLVSALLSSTAAPRAHAQNDAPIFTWPGTVKVSTSTLEIREGESATYNLWLTRQPSADGWWVRVHVDGVVRYDGGFDQPEGYKGIRWTPSVGWEFNKNNSNPAVATPPRGVTIRAVQDADDEDELVEFTHEVWDQNTNCPPSLHGIAKVTVRIIDDDRDSGGTLPKLSIQDTPVVEGNTAEFRVRLTPSSEQTVTVDFATADVTAEAGTDYTAQSDTLTFRAGQTIKRIFVPTTDDRFHEPEERFRVTLSNPSGATLADATGEGRISDNDRPELSIGSASVEEGNTARFEVRLAPPSEQTVTVDFATMNVTAEAETDYTARSGTLTFSARQTMMTISVPTTDDTERESDEHFRVTLSNPSGATLNDATGEGTIFDNDGGPTMLELSIGDASVEEGGMARFEVRLAPSNDQTVTVAYSTTDGTAAAGTDYTAQSDTLTFPASQTAVTMTISVQTTDDTERESDEHFRVTLSSPSGATLNDDTGEGTIIDNDGDGGGSDDGDGDGGGSDDGDGDGDGSRDVGELPTLSIDDATVVEGDLAKFEVTLSEAATAVVMVDYSTVDGTAVARSDYTTTSGTLSFEQGEERKTILVPTVQDATAEGTEVFTMQLSSPSGATVANGTGTGTITDDDEPPMLTIDDAPPVDEGDAAAFVVRLSAASGLAVTVAYRTVDGTAVAGSDYKSASGELRFEPGETTQTVTVETLADELAENTEQFTVELSAPLGATVADGVGEGTISDDDDAPELSIDDVPAVSEGETAEFTVRLSATSGRAVTVSYRTVDGTAVAGSDYKSASGELRFEPGETTQTVTVETLADELAENTEQFTVELSAPLGATVADGVGEGTISDDDDAPELSIDDVPAVSEGETAEFTVRLSATSGRAVTVSYRTVDGTAVAGSDYKSASGELRFEPGETTQTVTVETLADELAENTEQFTVELSAPLGATVADGVGEGTISDDDDAPELSIDDVPAVSEGETAEFTVRLSATSGRAVTVSYRTVDGTAVAGSDYKSASGELRFEPGETTQTVTVETLADELAENTEQFTVELSAPLGATVADGVGEGTISDDDDAPELSIDDVPAVSEGETAEFTVRLSATSGRAVTVSYRTVDGTAVAGSDYKSASGELRFEPGETTQTVTVETLADELAENTEQFTVELSAPLGATVADGVGEGTISDDDDAPELSIDDAPAVSEGETAAFVVRLSAASGLAVTVAYRTVDGTAVAGSDYKSASGELRFEPGEATQTVSVETLEDELSEDAERFTVELSAASGATVSDGIGEGTISDDDDAPELSIDDAPAVSEGETAEFTVRLSEASGAAVSVSYRTVDGTAVAGLDYAATEGTLRYEPGETTQTISAETLADGLAEDVERFTVELSAPSGATVADGTGVGTITDDAKERIGKINRVILPEVGRALAFSAVTCRIDQVLAGGTTRGRAALPPARPSLSPALASGRWASQPPLSGRPSLSPALTSGRWAAAGTQPLPLERTLDDLSFPVRSQEEEGGDGRFAAWGCADHRNLSGDPYGPIAWSGGVSSVHMGADTRLGPGLLAGVSLSRSWGSFDYQVGGRNSAAGGGKYQLGMAGVHPYLAWSVSPDLDVWGTVSHYRGDIRIVDDLVGRVQTSPATLNSGMMGVSGRLMTRGATTVKLKGDWGLASINAAGGGKVFEEATANIRRLRLRTEVSHARKLSAGKSLTPWGELGVRHDGGDGQHGTGLEVGGGLRFQDLGGGLTAESYGRWLASHHGTLQEWGFGALLRYAPGRSGRGPSVSLGPSWGDTASGVQRLWERGVTDPTLYEVPGSHLDAQFGYGFTAFRGRGLLTPYARLSLTHEAARGYRLGSRLALGPSASVSIEAQRRKYPAAPINHALLVLGTLQF